MPGLWLRILRETMYQACMVALEEFTIGGGVCEFHLIEWHLFQAKVSGITRTLKNYAGVAVRPGLSGLKVLSIVTL